VVVKGRKGKRGEERKPDGEKEERGSRAPHLSPALALRCGFTSLKGQRREKKKKGGNVKGRKRGRGGKRMAPLYSLILLFALSWLQGKEKRRKGF